MKSNYKNLFLKFNIGTKMLILFFANILFFHNFKIVQANEQVEIYLQDEPKSISSLNNIINVGDNSDELVIDVEISINDQIYETKKIITQFNFFKLDMSNYLNKKGIVALKIMDINSNIRRYELQFDFINKITPARITQYDTQINSDMYLINWNNGKYIDNYHLQIDIYRADNQLIESRSIQTKKNSYLLDLTTFNTTAGKLQLNLTSIVGNKSLDNSHALTIPFEIKNTSLESKYKAKIKFNSVTRNGRGDQFDIIEDHNIKGGEVNVCIEENDKYWINIDQKRKLYKAYWLLDIENVDELPECIKVDINNENKLVDVDISTLAIRGAEIYESNNSEISTLKSTIKYNSNTFTEQTNKSLESNKYTNKGEVVDACIENNNNYWIRISRDEQLYKAYWLLNIQVNELPECIS